MKKKFAVVGVVVSASLGLLFLGDGSNTGTLEFCMQQEVNPAYRSCLGSC